MYAVIETGGKQYKVAQGDVLRVEKIEAPVGEMVELDQVRLLAGDAGVVLEPSQLASAKVLAQVTGQGKLKKIVVFKKKRRKNYARTQGHRQLYTELTIREIQA